jgi:hypothetical protein
MPVPPDDEHAAWLAQAGHDHPLIGATAALERSIEAMEHLAKREFTGKVVACRDEQ